MLVRFLLIFALLFAQSGGLAHGISHALADQSQDQSAPHDKLCDLCAAYAQTGNAIGSSTVHFELSSGTDTPYHATFTQTDLAAFAAYASRAPPRST